ncbi:MAG: TonB C-terminal domain-containing protein [Candidatus Aminicenantes bacterium]|nr:TonB C-terminal domain-containing protein [Candidatus Aminicenantes bacterium]
MIHYVNLNFVSLPGGGGGAGGRRPGPVGEKAGQPEAVASKETMKELTVPQKAQPQAGSSLRHPVEKAPATKKPTPRKKTEISAPQPGTTTKAAKGTETGQAGGSGSGGGGGSGLRIGVGEGPGGFGTGYGDPLGTSSFPYTYYLQIIIDRVSSNWFTAINNLDYSGEYQSVIYFKILRNGQVADLKIEQPSDLPALDLTARRAVELAAPFPPLPRDFESEYLVVHLIFERSK